MTGDPKVLGPLQQAYSAATDERVQNSIRSAWLFETESWNVIYPPCDERIRAWTPPADPSLEQRVAELERRYSDLFIDITAGFIRVDRRIRAITQPDCICGTEDGASCPVHSHPEPTAPDDPVCATCGHEKRCHFSQPVKPEDGVCVEMHCACTAYVAAPAAADLDPVRVEAAAKAMFERNGNRTWRSVNQDVRDIWIEDSTGYITAYLNGGAS